MNRKDIETKLNDKAFRAALRENPELVSEIGYQYDENISYVVKTNTASKAYFAVLDTDNFSDENLAQINAAGGTAGSAASVASASTYGSICTTISSAGCVSTTTTAACS